MSKKRKVFQQQVVDLRTGEIISGNSIYVSTGHEVFGMYRKTDGLDWFLSLSGNEIKLMVLLSDFADERGYLSLSTMRRQFLMSALGIKSRRSLSGLIADLERKDMLFRTSQNDFLVNPATFFRCKSAELAERIMAYAAAKKGGYIKLIPIVNETD